MTRKPNPEVLGGYINDAMQFVLIGLCLSVFGISLHIVMQALSS